MAKEKQFGRKKLRKSLQNIFRTICEVAAVPESGIGIFGDLFKLLLTPQEDLDTMINGVSLVCSHEEGLPVSKRRHVIRISSFYEFG